MTQPSHNPLSFLKHPNTSNTSLERSGNTRSRSGSILRAISLHSPHPSSMPPTAADTSTALSRTNTNNSLAPSLNRAPLNSSNDEAIEAPFSCLPEDFEIKNSIGYGSSAVVYNAIYKPKNMRIAIKMIDLDFFERNQIDELRRETALMALSKHPNVLKVYGSFVNGSKLYIATPYLSGGSCLDIMRNGFQDGFDELAIATILKQALEGLVYLHRNNHIHRDVKAGNLLMDDQGTVLLADFGVSSSLTENNEVRKTFVGTPCWMAPEVMEQSGYDFKADIWSFGITALELATGHAPFAKFAPMKVLMMTLNQSPPTLDREHTKYKYSRLFKEMIDCCLKKDPSKRPTAEKLLLHPFFKQAKKKDYLVRTVLACVPPLEQRTHRKTSFKQTTIDKNTIQQWDFDNSDEENRDNEIHSLKNTNPADEPSPIATNTNRKSHISFGDVVVNNGKSEKSDLPSPALTEPEIASPVPVRKSRFVIEDNSYPATDRSDITMSSQRSLSPSSNNNNSLSAHSLSRSPTPSSATATSIFHGHSPPATTDNSWQSTVGVGLGICTNSVNPTGVVPSTQQQQENVEVLRKGRFSVNQQNAPSSIRTANIDSNHSKSVEVALPPESPYEVRSYPMSRITSNDSLKGVERKSRFEVQHLQPQPPTPIPQTATSTAPQDTLPVDNQQPHVKQEFLPMTREQSSYHRRDLSRESFSSSSKVGRFSIEKEDTPFEEPLHPFETPSNSITPGSPECRKKGRFELTGAMTPAERLESPHTTLTGTSSQASVAAGLAAFMHQSSDEQQRRQPHNNKSPYLAMMDPQQQSSVHAYIEMLQKQTETQKAMLQDLLFSFSHGGKLSATNTAPSYNRTRASSAADVRKLSTSNSSNDSHPSFPVDSSRKPSVQSDISSTMDHLQHLLVSSYQEKDRLSKENDLLKKEVEKLKRQQQLSRPSSTTKTVVGAGILKPSPPIFEKPMQPNVEGPSINTHCSGSLGTDDDEKHNDEHVATSN